MNHCYILGCEEQFISDNQPLINLFKSQHTLQRVARLRTALADYNMSSISHVNGKFNLVADALICVKLPDTVDEVLDTISALCNVTKVDLVENGPKSKFVCP